jgi:predicted ArsR family transcriptional regulator
MMPHNDVRMIEKRRRLQLVRDALRIKPMTGTQIALEIDLSINTLRHYLDDMEAMGDITSVIVRSCRPPAKLFTITDQGRNRKPEIVVVPSPVVSGDVVWWKIKLGGNNAQAESQE